MEPIWNLLMSLALAAATRSTVAVDSIWSSYKNEETSDLVLHLEKYERPNSHKFWKISLSGTTVSLSWGRLSGFGSSPWQRMVSLTFDTPTLAREDALRRLKVKLRTGYGIKKGAAL
jgi:predicted DNA-binding WGR domain protein